ncbi:MAG: helix-turn-helix domain-containing protein [Candidatus Dormibacteria bacterium]
MNMTEQATSVRRIAANGELQGIGISTTDERTYRHLVDHPGLGASEIAAALNVPQHAVRRSLAALEAKGLASRTASTSARYLPTPPASAISVLILQRQQDLERVQLVAASLQERFRAAAEREKAPQLVEVAVGRDAFVQRFEQLQRLARTQVRVFDKPPYADRGPSAPNTVQLEMLGRGIRYRTIYDREALVVPGSYAEIATLAAAGEEARTYKGVPIKLAIADEVIGLMPLRLDEADMAGLVVHPSPLLDALVHEFEMLWERASPVAVAGMRAAFASPKQSNGEETVSVIDPVENEYRETLGLLAAGLKDEAIAQQLGVATRTIARRIRRMMITLGADSRFEAGVEAVRRGWI